MQKPLEGNKSVPTFEFDSSPSTPLPSVLISSHQVTQESSPINNPTTTSQTEECYCQGLLVLIKQCFFVSITSFITTFSILL